MILFQSGYGSQRAFSVRLVSEVLHAVVAGGRTCRMTGYVHVKAHFQRIGSGRVVGPEVGFTAMDGVVTVVFEYLCQRGNLRGAFHTGLLANAVNVPFGINHNGVRLLVGGILTQRPACHPVSRGVHTRKKADARRRADTARVGLCKHFALSCQTLHVGRMVRVVVAGALCPERQGRVLPSHIIH